MNKTPKYNEPQFSDLIYIADRCEIRVKVNDKGALPNIYCYIKKKEKKKTL